MGGWEEGRCVVYKRAIPCHPHAPVKLPNNQPPTANSIYRVTSPPWCARATIAARRCSFAITPDCRGRGRGTTGIVLSNLRHCWLPQDETETRRPTPLQGQRQRRRDHTPIHSLNDLPLGTFGGGKAFLNSASPPPIHPLHRANPKTRASRIMLCT